MKAITVVLCLMGFASPITPSPSARRRGICSAPQRPDGRNLNRGYRAFLVPVGLALIIFRFRHHIRIGWQLPPENSLRRPSSRDDVNKNRSISRHPSPGSSYVKVENHGIGYEVATFLFVHSAVDIKHLPPPRSVFFGGRSASNARSIDACWLSVSPPREDLPHRRPYGPPYIFPETTRTTSRRQNVQ